MSLPDACKQLLKEWKFAEAFGAMGSNTTDEEAETLYALAATFGDVGHFGAEMSNIIAAAVRDMLKGSTEGWTAPQPPEQKADAKFVHMADRYDGKARMTRDCVDAVFKHVKAPADPFIQRRDDYTDVPLKMAYIKKRWDELRDELRSAIRTSHQ